MVSAVDVSSFNVCECVWAGQVHFEHAPPVRESWEAEKVGAGWREEPQTAAFLRDDSKEATVTSLPRTVCLLHQRNHWRCGVEWEVTQWSSTTDRKLVVQCLSQVREAGWVKEKAENIHQGCTTWATHTALWKCSAVSVVFIQFRQTTDGGIPLIHTLHTDPSSCLSM